MTMLFFWILLFILAFVGTILLVFYMTLELNELDKVVSSISEIILKRYAPEDDKKKKL